LPPESLGIVINKFCNGFAFHNRQDATGDTVELLVTQKRLNAGGILLKDYSPQSNDGAFDNGGGYYFSDTAAVWKNLRAGTFIVLSWTSDAPRAFGDTLIRAGLQNSAYFIPARSGIMNLYNIGIEDLLMLRRKGVDFFGSSGCIHAFAVGLTRATVDSINLPLIMVSTPSSTQKANGNTPYAIAKTTGRTVTDFGKRDDATTVLSLPFGFGRAHSVENQALVNFIKQ
jgi:hypothetical protein